MEQKATVRADSAAHPFTRSLSASSAQKPRPLLAHDIGCDHLSTFFSLVPALLPSLQSRSHEISQLATPVQPLHEVVSGLQKGLCGHVTVVANEARRTLNLTSSVNSVSPSPSPSPRALSRHPHPQASLERCFLAAASLTHFWFVDPLYSAVCVNSPVFFHRIFSILALPTTTALSGYPSPQHRFALLFLLHSVIFTRYPASFKLLRTLPSTLPILGSSLSTELQQRHSPALLSVRPAPGDVAASSARRCPHSEIPILLFSPCSDLPSSFLPCLF